MLDFLTNGREAQPIGNADPFEDVTPNECFRTADGRWLAVSCRDDVERGALRALVGDGSGQGDGEGDALEAWVRAHAGDEAQARLQEAGVPAGLVQDGGDLMADPQLVARGLWRTCAHAVFGERPFDRFPALFSAMDLEPYLPPPSYVGEHNFDVYSEIAGMDAADVAEGMAGGLFS